MEKDLFGMQVRIIHWEEPNRRNTPPMHIAARGDRFSTLTGVSWIDTFRFVVNHRSGLRVALFDTRVGNAPVAVESIPHLTDDIAAKQIDEKTWEVAVSGCWDCAYSIYRLTIKDHPKCELIFTNARIDKTFCHRVAYDSEGRLCLAFSTGENPCIEIGSQTWSLPRPWGARDVCSDEKTGQLFAVAVSKTPALSSYDQTATTLWLYESEKNAWKTIANIEDMHSDACQIDKGRIWLSDQLGDRVLGIDLNGKKPPIVIKGELFDFPHGL